MSEEGIDLAQAVDETTADVTLEKKAELKKKIRHVLDQITIFADQKRRLTGELQKADEKLIKAQGKITELRKGNWEILKQINTKDEPAKEGASE